MKIKNNLLRNAFRKEPVIIYIGQSGCGKGTLQETTVKTYEKLLPGKPYLCVETGLLLRDCIPSMSELNVKRLHDRQIAGHLQSWVIATTLWATKYLMMYKGGPVIVDGSPRSIKEVEAVIDFYQGYAEKEIIIFFLAISDEEARKRLLHRNEKLALAGQPIRQDIADPKALEIKLQFFPEHVVPALNKIKGYDNVTFHTINAMEPKNIVAESVLSKIAAHYLV